MGILDRIKHHGLKVSLILTVILIGELNSGTLTAQSLKNFASRYGLGFEGTFGIRSFSISSDIAKIDGLNVMEEGGSIGIRAGVNALAFRLKQGYYYSSSAGASTVDVVKSAGFVNFYPLQLVMKGNFVFQPYLVGGMERNIFKMYGFYGKEANGHQEVQTNYSISEAPFLGKISTIYASLGAGLEYSIKNPGHFVGIFMEARYGKPIRSLAANSIFKNTGTSMQLEISAGIAFGYHR